MMNCDQAFETMTTRDTELGHELEQHLSGCARCREMAEVLSPVLVELHSVRRVLDTETKSANPREDWGVKLARRTAQDLAQRTAQTTRRDVSKKSLKSQLVFAAIILIFGVTGGWGMSMLQSDPPRNASVPALSTAENCTLLHPELRDSRSPRTVTLTCIACHLSVDAN